MLELAKRAGAIAEEIEGLQSFLKSFHGNRSFEIRWTDVDNNSSNGKRLFIGKPGITIGNQDLYEPVGAAITKAVEDRIEQLNTDLRNIVG